jgi:outer membrane lipoprotein-sorting protein
MKSYFSRSLSTALVLLFGVVSACSAQTPQKIIDDYLHAEGGAKALAKVQSVTITGNLREGSAETSGSYSLIIKAPNKFYSEVLIEPQHNILASNGMSAWSQEAGGAPHTFTGAEAVEWAATGRYLNEHLVNAKKDKIGARLVGVENVSGRQAYHVEFVIASGVTREVFFDTQTHLIVRELILAPALKFSPAGDKANSQTAEKQPAGVSEEIDYFDYKPVSGILEPNRIELHRGGHFYQIAVTRVEINAPVQDSIFDFPRKDDRPLPDIAKLLIDIDKNQRTVEEILKQYTFHLSEEEEKTDSNGQVSSRSVKEYDIFYIGEDEIRHLLAKDGKPLEGDEKKKEDERFNKDFDEKKKKQAELQNDPKKQAKQEQAQISDFLRAERFTNPRRELFRGQEVIVFDFGRNPDYKPKKLVESIVQKLSGVLWVDEQARDVARLEARFNDNVKIGGGLLASLSKGSNLVLEQTMVNNEVWLPSYAEVHAAARVVFFKVKQNEIDRYSDYKKFSSEVKLGTSTPVEENSPK